MKYEEFVGMVESRLKDLILGRRSRPQSPRSRRLENA